MAQKIPEQALQTLLQHIAAWTHGVGLGELLASANGGGVPRRTLQRWLSQLVSRGVVVTEGEGRARRYRVAEEGHASLRGRTMGSVGEVLARGGGVGNPGVVGVNYHLVDDLSKTPVMMVREDPPDMLLVQDWISREGREIRAIMQRPLSERVPVGYDAGFLAGYVPNETYYLPLRLRLELEDIGRVGTGAFPAGTYLRQVLDRLLIDLSWNSSRLEGNTYSLLETQRLLELGEDAEGRATLETQMILNHKAAIEMLAEDASLLDFNSYTICNLHALLAENLLPDPASGGRVRSRPVGVSGTVYHPLAVPQLVEARFGDILEKAAAIQDPFEQAFFAMVHLPYLQPFEDVNKRVSRLAANIPLVRQNLCPLSFVDVDRSDYVSALLGVYELRRVEYLRDVFVHAYRRSCARYSAVRQALGEPDPFRLRLRAEIGAFVREVVRGAMDKRVATQWIARESAIRISAEERARFIEVVETELGCLHIGNIARYRLRPSEYEGWSKGWR